MYYLFLKKKEKSGRRGWAGKEWVGAADAAGGKPGECEVSKARSREWTNMTDATERSSMERAGLKNVQYTQQQQVTCNPNKNYFGGRGSWELAGAVGVGSSSQIT